MGLSALIVLRYRIKSRVTGPLLLFQALFLTALGMSLGYYYLQGLSDFRSVLPTVLFWIIMLLNALLYAVIVVLLYRLMNLSEKSDRFSRILYIGAMISASLSVIKVGSNIFILAFSASDSFFAAWSLFGYILNTVSMLLFGIAALRSVPVPGESKIIGSLLRGFGICTLVFAPIGLTEYLFEALKLPGGVQLSLDHFYYLAWNIISMSAAVRLFRPASDTTAYEDSVPDERVRALGLTEREREAALLISKGFSNKEIAAELGISPATVRTHIYNLYKKADARSRVELVNNLKN